MSYRIEAASTGRAGCKNKPCKDEGIKIEKGELRFGVWVVIQEHGSFQWRHWGCVSGKVLENLRSYLEQGDPDTGYKWDYFDGLDELPEKDQEKVKKAVIEGKISDEDWRGDPAFNVLGQAGTVAKKKKAKKSDESEENGDTPTTPAKSPAVKKGRGKKTTAEDDGEEETKPAIKSKRRVKKEVKNESGDEVEVKPTVKREKKVKNEIKDESGDEIEVKPAAKKAVAKKTSSKKEEASDGELSMVDIPAKKPSAKNAAAKKKEADDELNMDDIPAKKAPAKKSAVKKATVNNEDGDAGGDSKPTKKAPVKKAAPKRKVKSEDSESEEAEVRAKPTISSRADRAAKRSASDLNENTKPRKKGKASAEELMRESDTEDVLLRDVLGGGLEPSGYRLASEDDDNYHHLYAMGMGGSKVDF